MSAAFITALFQPFLSHHCTLQNGSLPLSISGSNSSISDSEVVRYEGLFWYLLRLYSPSLAQTDPKCLYRTGYEVNMMNIAG